MAHRQERTYTYAERIHQEDDFLALLLLMLLFVHSFGECQQHTVSYVQCIGFYHSKIYSKSFFRSGNKKKKICRMRWLTPHNVYVYDIQSICILAQRTKLLILFADKVETLLKKYLLMFYLYLFIYFFSGKTSIFQTGAKS